MRASIVSIALLLVAAPAFAADPNLPAAPLPRRRRPPSATRFGASNGPAHNGRGNRNTV